MASRSKLKDVAYVDFETKGIEKRPAYPPEPVGVALELPGEKPEYLSWGSPNGGNNCTKDFAYRRLKHVWTSKDRICFHNGKFDLDVADVWMGLPVISPDRVEDTGVLGFLEDPRAFDHRLKTLARVKLGMEATERDELKAWVLANCKEQLGRKTKGWEAYMWMAPGDLMGKYSVTDIRMTKKLREYYQPTAVEMATAYDRERALTLVLLDMERHGVNVDVPALQRDVKVYEALLEKIDVWVRKRLGAPKDLNIDADQDLADWLERSGKVAPDRWVLTAKGSRSVSADSLKYMLDDKELFGALQYRGTLSTCVGTFMRPWLLQGLSNDGVAYVEWNQFKEKGLGTKSGRLSSSPNFQNIPTELDDINAARPKWCPPLPLVRKYIVAPKGYVFVDRDYNSQEYRLFAHYEDDKLAAAYRADPWQDIHQFVTDLVNAAAGSSFKRRAGKTINFGILYGQGVYRLAAQLGVPLDVAKKIIAIYLHEFEGVDDLRKLMDSREENREPIWTIGGRKYYAEERVWKDGWWKKFAYRLVNLLIQAGSADITKQAMIDYHFKHRKDGRLVMQVHDELPAVAPIKAAKAEMKRLKTAMEDNELVNMLDVPMLSNGFIGPNFQDLEELPRGE